MENSKFHDAQLIKRKIDNIQSVLNRYRYGSSSLRRLYIKVKEFFGFRIHYETEVYYELTDEQNEELAKLLEKWLKEEQQKFDSL